MNKKSFLLGIIAGILIAAVINTVLIRKNQNRTLIKAYKIGWSDGWFFHSKKQHQPGITTEAGFKEDSINFVKNIIQ